jgi:hypothetical protein
MRGAGIITGRQWAALEAALRGFRSGNSGACIHIHLAFMVIFESMRQTMTQQIITRLAHNFQCRDTGTIIGAHARTQLKVCRSPTCFQNLHLMNATQTVQFQVRWQYKDFSSAPSAHSASQLSGLRLPYISRSLSRGLPRAL